MKCKKCCHNRIINNKGLCWECYEIVCCERCNSCLPFKHIGLTTCAVCNKGCCKECFVRVSDWYKIYQSSKRNPIKDSVCLDCNNSFEIIA